MKRIDGYLDLEEYFKRTLKRKTVNLDDLESKKVVKQCLSGVYAMFWFKYMGVNVLFKRYPNEYNRFSELISEELAKYLGLKSAQYDLATFQNKKGVISYDFRKENYSYITLDKILDYYVAKKNLFENENKENTDDYFLRDYSKADGDDIITNLEDIWIAIEYYLYQNENIKKDIIPSLVEKIMLELTDYFTYQIISGNYDMHSANITVAFKNDYSDIELSALYDNGDMYELSDEIDYIRPNTPRLAVKRGNVVNDDTAMDTLKDFLAVSDLFFIDRFKRKLDMINDDTIFYIYKLVENKIEIEIPNEIKKEIAKEFNENLKAMKKVVISLKR